MDYEIIRIDRESLYLIEPLWEKLNAMHGQTSLYFAGHYRKQSFADRQKAIYFNFILRYYYL